MNQWMKWMESSLFGNKRLIQTSSDVFWTIQFARDILKNDEQYSPRTTTWRSTSKLYGWLCDICQNQEGTRGTNNLILKDSRKAQFLLQMIKM